MTVAVTMPFFLIIIVPMILLFLAVYGLFGAWAYRRGGQCAGLRLGDRGDVSGGPVAVWSRRDKGG